MPRSSDYHELTPGGKIAKQERALACLQGSLADNERSWIASGFSKIANPMAAELIRDIEAQKLLIDGMKREG
jgi:hypothetical protein